MSKQDDVDPNKVKNAVEGRAQSIFDMMKIELSKVECPEHGQALKSLDQDRKQGGVKIDTCCPQGEELVMDAIDNL